MKSTLSQTSLLFCLITAVLMSSCDMLQMPDKMDDMKNQTHTDMTNMKSQTHDDMTNMQNQTKKMGDDTNDGLRLSKIGVALQNITADANTEYFLPVPADMMPWAQLLADNLHEDEFVKLMDLWARRITQVAAGCSDLPGGKCTPELVARADHEKQAKFWAIASVSGLMSQEMIVQTVQTEYTDGGQFNETLYQILAARQTFMSSVLMDNTLMQKDFDNLGKLKKAVEYASDLQYIADLPFASKIDFNLSAMLDPADQMDVAFDPTVAQTEWSNINAAFNTQLQKNYRDEMTDPSNPNGQELVALRAVVQSHLKHHTP